MTHKLCQNANFENGGTTIQVSILHVLLNILSISSLPRVHDTSVNLEMQQEMSQTRDECPQRNWSSIRHICGKLAVI